MRRIGWIMAGTLALGLSACGPASYDGSGGFPGNPEGTFENPGDPQIDTTRYAWVDYDFLRGTIENTLGVGDTSASCADGINPECAPLNYLEERKYQVGASDYEGELPDDALVGTITAPGMKTWVFAATGSCGIAMNGAQFDQLFPNGINDFDTLYLSLLSRYPSDAEQQVFQDMYSNLEASWQTLVDTYDPGTPEYNKGNDALSNADTANRRKAAAACSTVLSSLEFLTIN